MNYKGDEVGDIQSKSNEHFYFSTKFFNLDRDINSTKGDIYRKNIIFYFSIV